MVTDFFMLGLRRLLYGRYRRHGRHGRCRRRIGRIAVGLGRIVPLGRLRRIIPRLRRITALLGRIISRLRRIVTALRRIIATLYGRIISLPVAAIGRIGCGRLI